MYLAKRAAVPVGGKALWRRTTLKADTWRSELGSSEHLCRAVRYGIGDMPFVPFTEGLVPGESPNRRNIWPFGTRFENGCKEKVYEKKSNGEVRAVVSFRNVVSSAFVIWHGVEEKKGRFVVSITKQSKHWSKGSKKMETLIYIPMDLQKGNVLMSWDINGEYHHFYQVVLLL